MAHRVLVADDDPATLSGLRALLSAWGYEAETASDGRAALEKVATVHPEVVITDVVMPVMTGFELMGALRARSETMPVIVLTAHSGLDSLLVASRQGAYAYLAKPVDVAKLKAVLANALTETSGETTRGTTEP